MRIHLYAQCWNDEFMLPFFFRHYDSFVDRYVLFDDGSSDRTLEILASHPRVEVRRFVRSHPESFVFSEQAFSNGAWKESRGQADWVIVTDVDEHLYHPSLRDYLHVCSAAGITLVPALGFQMISDDVPHQGETLCETRTSGAPWSQMMKPSIFDPNRIEEINFSVGRHTAQPVGNVRAPDRDEVLLLHYKYLGIDQTFARFQQLAKGLGRLDVAKNLGHKYSWSMEQLRADWKITANAAVNVGALKMDPRKYPIEPWWDALRGSSWRNI